MNRNEYDDLKKMLEGVLSLKQKSDQGDLEACHELAFVKDELGETEEAIELYEKATKYGSGITFFNLGRIYHKNLQFDKAIHNYELAAKQDIQPTFFNLGQVHEELKNHDQAYKSHEKAISAGDNKGYFNIGALKLKTKNYEGARIYFKKAIDAGIIEAFNEMGQLERKCGNLDLARDYLIQGCDKFNEEAFCNLADIENETGNSDLARLIYRLAIFYDMNSAYYGIGNLEKKSGNLEKAKKYLESGSLTGCYDCCSLLTSIYLEAGNVTEALKYYHMTSLLGEENDPDLEPLKSKLFPLIEAQGSNTEYFDRRLAFLITSENRKLKDSNEKSEGVIFVKGFNTEINALVNKCKDQNIGVQIFNMDTECRTSLNNSYYFVTSFRNMLTSYEVEFLKKHPLIKNIIMIDPDFDEYEDVVIDCKRRFPDKVFHVYDERAFTNSSASIYSRDQIDLIHSNTREIVAVELLKNRHFDFETSLNHFAELSVEDSDRVMEEMSTKFLKPSFQTFRKELQKSIAPVTKLDVKEISGKLFFENDTFDTAIESKLTQVKLWSIVVFFVTVLIDFFHYNNFNASMNGVEFFTYVKSRTWPITVYSAVFMMMHFALIAFEYKWVEFRKHLTKRDKDLVDCVNVALAENTAAIVNSLSFSRMLNNEFDQSEKAITGYMKNNPFRQYTNERRQGVLKSTSKKAA